VPIPPAAAKK